MQHESITEKKNVQFKYALLDNSDSTICIYDDGVDRDYAKKHIFYCPHCRKEMYATFGEFQAWHFRHKGCKCRYNDYLHALAEHVFIEEYNRCLESGEPFYLDFRLPIPCNRACVLKEHIDCSEHYVLRVVDLTQEYRHISCEKRVVVNEGYRRPDILLKSDDGKELWVEIWVSHKTEEDKLKDGRIIEIKIHSEEDIEAFRNHTIIQSEDGYLAVSVFGIEADGDDKLFTIDEKDVITELPCDNFFVFENGEDGVKGYIADINQQLYDGNLCYRIILRLNWKERHDSTKGCILSRFSESELRRMCLNRQYKVENNSHYLLEPIVVDEYRAPEGADTAQQDVIQRKVKGVYNNTPPSTVRKRGTSIDDIVWVDLGLPSGTLWADTNAEEEITFCEAIDDYQQLLPSGFDAEELSRCCQDRHFSDKQLILIGPNGNSISFPCKNGDQSYWLNDYVSSESKYARCINVIPPETIRINDKDCLRGGAVRLVKKK